MDDGTPKYMTIKQPPNELQFVDDDIREAFEGTNFITGTPTHIQLARNVAKLTKILEEKFYYANPTPNPRPSHPPIRTGDGGISMQLVRRQTIEGIRT